jgi:hypothetical protein
MLDRWGHVLAVDLTGDPLGPRGLALAPLGGLAMVRPGWCAFGVCGNTGEGRLVNVCRARNELSGRQIGGSTDSPRPSRGRRAEGMGDDGTRDTASTRARTSASAGRLFAGGLRDVTHVAHSSGAGCFFSRTHLASAFVYRNNTNAVNTDSRRCAETRARACGAGSARVERVCACAIDALAGVGVRCGRAV